MKLTRRPRFALRLLFFPESVDRGFSIFFCDYSSEEFPSEEAIFSILRALTTPFVRKDERAKDRSIGRSLGCVIH